MRIAEEEMALTMAWNYITHLRSFLVPGAAEVMIGAVVYLHTLTGQLHGYYQVGIPELRRGTGSTRF